MNTERRLAASSSGSPMATKDNEPASSKRQGAGFVTSADGRYAMMVKPGDVQVRDTLDFVLRLARSYLLSGHSVAIKESSPPKSANNGDKP